MVENSTMKSGVMQHLLKTRWVTSQKDARAERNRKPASLTTANSWDSWRTFVMAERRSQRRAWHLPSEHYNDRSDLTRMYFCNPFRKNISYSELHLNVGTVRRQRRNVYLDIKHSTGKDKTNRIAVFSVTLVRYVNAHRANFYQTEGFLLLVLL